MKYFSVPADFKKENLDLYAAINEQFVDSKIYETYGQVTIDDFIGSGRMVDCLPTIDLKNLSKYVEYSKNIGIDFNYTLNSSCIGNAEFSKKTSSKIKELLENIYASGIHTITVTLPFIFDLIQSMDIPFKVKTSTICQVSTANAAIHYKKMGASQIVVDENITRDFASLKQISNAFGDGVEIIVNSICYKNCPYKNFHYNHESHCTALSDGQDTKDYYHIKCVLQKADDPINALKLNWIRPEDIKFYENIGIQYFKLQGRQFAQYGDPVKTLKAYINGHYEGNLLQLLTFFTLPQGERFIENKKLDGFLDPFINKRNFCIDDCNTCLYCAEYASKCMDINRTKHINNFAKNKYEKELFNLIQSLAD